LEEVSFNTSTSLIGFLDYGWTRGTCTGEG
jgi:hypothetical protein